MSTPRALRLNAEDNVVIAVDEIRLGDSNVFECCLKTVIVEQRNLRGLAGGQIA